MSRCFAEPIRFEVWCGICLRICGMSRRRDVWSRCFAHLDIPRRPDDLGGPNCPTTHGPTIHVSDEEFEAMLGAPAAAALRGMEGPPVVIDAFRLIGPEGVELEMPW